MNPVKLFVPALPLALLFTVLSVVVQAEPEAAGPPAAKPPAPTTAPASPASSVGLENFSGHAVTDVRIDGGQTRDSLEIPRCDAQWSVAAKAVAFDAAKRLRISIAGDGGRRRSAEFTGPLLPCGGESGVTCTVFIAHDDQVVVRIAGNAEADGADRWHVPDDHLGHVEAKAMPQPEVLGVGPRDPFFDTAEALVRYPLYDEFEIVRPGGYLGGFRRTAEWCGGRLVREIPESAFYKVIAVRDDAVTFVGEKGRIEVKPAADAGPAAAAPGTVPGEVAGTPRARGQGEEGGLSAWLGKMIYSGPQAQSIGVSNWSDKPIRDVKIEAGGRIYAWDGEVRPGGGHASVGGVSEVTVAGKVHVAYTDGAGLKREADFEDVPTEKGIQDPDRDFYFDAGGNVLLHAQDLSDHGPRGEKWCLPKTDGPPGEKLPLPQLLAVAPAPGLPDVWFALVRYPRNDRIGTYNAGDMLGGEKDDFTSRQTKEGDARYRIEEIGADRMVLVREGKRTTIPLQDKPRGAGK